MGGRVNESGDIVIEGLITVADRDLELKGGEGVCLPCWLFFLLQFILMRLSIFRVNWEIHYWPADNPLGHP